MTRHRARILATVGMVFFVVTALIVGSFFVSHHALAATQATYYVSPSGSDNNSGTDSNHPFATIDHARQVVQTVNSNMTGDIVVYLLGGTYNITSTLAFTPADSGTNGHQIIYQAYPGQTPVLSGGTQVTGWTQYSGSIYQAPLARADKLRSLYVNDHRAVMTSKKITSQGCWGRYAVTAGQASWAWVSGSQADGVQFTPSDFPQVSSNITDVEMSTNTTWNQAIVTLRGTTTSGNFTVAQLQQPYGAIAEQVGYGAGFQCGSGKQVTIYNAFSLLNTPGQFYFDRAAQTLYYDAMPGENMATATVIAPNDNLTTLLNVAGTSTSNRVQNLTFAGLTFAYSDWLLQSVAGSYGKATVQGSTVSIAFAQGNWHKDVYRSIDTIPAAVLVDSSQNITFSRNVFKHTGADGLAERNDVTNSQTLGNNFFDIGGTSFTIAHPQHVYIGDGGTNEKFPPGVEGACINDTFKDNMTNYTGVLFKGQSAVAAFFVNKFDFEHNVLQNTPWNGLSMGWGWHNFNGASDSVFPGNPTTVAGNNTVSYNDFFNMVQTLTDTGAIYTLGSQPNTNMTNNYINGIPNNGKSEGIHLDEGSAGITVTNSVINVTPGALTFSAGNWGQQTNLSITNTYSTTGAYYKPIAVNSVEDAPLVYATANWPAAALSIIQSAGLEAPYLGNSYEAENGTVSGGASVASDHTGYTGTGFVATSGTQGAAVRVPVTVAAAGTYTLTIRYANGSFPSVETKTLSLYANSTKVGQLTYPATSNWNTWSTITTTVSLAAGSNTLTFQIDAGDIGWLNLDSFTLK